MTTYATDKDLLHWEPNIFTDAASVAQTMLSGSGNLEGTVFSIVSSGSVTLGDAQVATGNVIVFSGAINGSYPIVEIVNPTKLAVSVLYDRIIEQPSLLPAPPGWSDGINFAVRTFWPLRSVVSRAILEAARIQPENADAMILNPELLRRPCVLGTLEMIHSAVAASADAPAEALGRAELYQSLYRRALRAVTLELDLNGDGKVDERRSMNVLQLKRA
jgi:hypothetical protein